MMITPAASKPNTHNNIHTYRKKVKSNYQTELQNAVSLYYIPVELPAFSAAHCVNNMQHILNLNNISSNLFSEI
jgi:hypothetical protein